jgi:uncharacterized integral membrane protein
MDRRQTSDESVMQISPALFALLILAVSGAVLTLYIMRRRVRQGRRTPKF